MPTWPRKRLHLDTLRLALPEVERRAAEEVETHPEARDQAVG